MRALGLGVALLSLLIPPPAPAQGAGSVVAVVDYSFAPGTSVVTRGGTLTFANLDSAQLIAHTASYPVRCGLKGRPRCRWTTGALDASRPVTSVTISLRPGTYTYYCRVHPFMRGTVTVVA